MQKILLFHHMNKLLFKIVILNCNNISQCNDFNVFYKVNSALVNMRVLSKKCQPFQLFI